MKLCTLKTKHRDGQLCVVNKALTHAISAKPVASTLQFALENWQTVAPELDKIYQQLNLNTLSNVFPFDPHHMESPLPRSFQWADGSAYVNHV